MTATMDIRQRLQETLGTTYVLDRELGGGGMSRVFVADERRLNRKVVIKVLSPELSAGVSGERFEQEIQLVASLQQANIVPILAAGETAGLPFYTMPFVEGESLRARLAKEGRLSVGMVINILRDVSKALAYAHERGVIHRDIKPDNVLLSGGTAVVTDFGIAKALAAARTEHEGATLTQAGTSIGTPAYMAPEQAAGDPAVDHRADIYSLGCTAYELLTGQSPFHGRPPARMVLAHITEAPPPISQSRPDVPAELQQLIMRCLAKDPAQRPQSGTAMLEALDVAAESRAATTGEIISTARMRQNGLAIYAAAFVLVAILARASVVAFGLPDWVFLGALAVMLLGLPVVAFAWYADRVRHRATTAVTTSAVAGGTSAPVGPMAGLALRASSHVTWRRVMLGGVGAFSAFVLVVVAFLVSRALGIGPAGSLLAAGTIADRERLIVTEFQSPDSSLGTLVTEAVRTNLGQSRVVSIVPPVAINATLQRMQRSPASRLDLALAREIAQRDGVRAIVDGAIRAIGGGYIVSLRLVSADSAKELVAFQETADDPRELLDAIDDLTRQLRGRMGESLREVRASPPLEQVTTGSLDALRVYAEASRAIDQGGNPIEAAERLREAVRLDTAFAMAYRKLGVALNNSGLPRPSVDSALERAYRFRDRLTERERLLAVATYYHLGPGRDRRQAIRAYDALIALDPNETGALNNSGTILMGRREFARAESVYKRAIASGRPTAQNYTNLISALYNGGKVDEAQRNAEELRRRFPGTLFAATSPVSFLYGRGQLDSMELVLTQLAKNESPILRINGQAGLANYAVLQGRLNEAMKYIAETQRLQQTLGGTPPLPVNDSLQLSWIDLMYHEDTTRATARMERTLRASDVRSLPFDQRPYLAVATFFASAGDPLRARAWLTQHDTETPDSATRRLREPDRHAVLGMIALAERRYAEGIRELWRADTTYDGPNGNCGICVLDDIGWAWNHAGVADSAIHYWEIYLRTPFFGRQNFDGLQRPLILSRLGALYESKGDVVKAAERYREFLKLWARADASLQPKVADVQWRLSRLADVERR